jgi:anaerobic selenocysteine-containing dehydrogenase
MNSINSIKTVCARDCYDACSLVFHVDEHQNITSVHGDAEHPLTRGMVCPRSARDRDRLLSNRIDSPFIKEANGFKKISWDRGLELISRKLAHTIAKQGPHGILFLNYAGNTGLLANAFPARLWNALGAAQTDGALCSKSGHTGISTHYGDSYGANPLEIPSMKLLVFWGFNAAVSAPHIWHLALTAQKKGRATIVVVDPIQTDTAKKADLWIRTKPETDVALVYGLLNRLITSGKADAPFIEKWTTGFDRLKAEAAKWPPETIQQITGVSPDTLQLLTNLYAGNKPSMTLIGYGLQHCENGADQARAVAMIPSVLGIHRGFFYGNGSAFLLDRSRIKGESLTDKKPKIIQQVAVADHIKQGDFSVVYVSCMNPAMTLPNQNAFREGLARDDLFLIVHETHWTETAKLADIVLPAPTFLEKEDIVLPDSHNCVQFSRQVVSPVTDSRHEIQVMTGIARRLGLQEPWLYEDALTAIASAMQDAFENGDLQDLMSGRRLRLACKPRDRYPTPSGKMEFYAHAARARGQSPMPTQKEWVAETEQFTFMASSVSNHTHTQFQEVYGSIPAVVHINPKDAAKSGIDDGENILLRNHLGSLRLRAVISEALPEGVVWSPKEAADLDGIAQNSLMSSQPQAMGNGPRFNTTRVSLEKLEKGGITCPKP